MSGHRNSRALVTGAAGFLGSAVVRSLIGSGSETHALVRPGSDLWRIHDVPRLVVHTADLSDLPALRRVVDEVRPGFVFHLAAAGAYPGKRERQRVFESNVVATSNLLAAVAGQDVERIVYTASSLETGPKPHPIADGEVLQPTTWYGVTKAASTLLFQQAARAGSSPVVCVRPFSIYGPREPSSRLIPTAVRAGLGGEVLRLTPPGFVRDLVYVEDVAEACLLAGRAETATAELFSIGSGVMTSNQEIVAAVEAALGRPIQLEHGAYPAHDTDTTHWVADRRRARQVLGWEPRTTLDEGMARTVAWWLENVPRLDSEDPIV